MVDISFLSSSAIFARFRALLRQMHLGWVFRPGFGTWKAQRLTVESEEAIQDMCSSVRQLSSSVIVEISPSLVLVRRLQLPKGAAKHRKSIIGLQLKQTLPNEGAGLSWRIGAVQSGASGESVTVWIVKEVVVEQVSNWVRACGASLHSIVIADPSAANVNFAYARKFSSRPEYLWGMAAVGIPMMIVGGFIIWLAHTVDNLEEHRGQLRSLIDEQLIEAQKLVDMRATRDARIKQLELQLSMMRQHGQLGSVLATLTSALPDDTYLAELSLDDVEVTLSVFSKQGAPEILRVLQDLPIFSKVQLIGPALRDPLSSNNRFRLSLQLQMIGPSTTRSRP